MKQKIKTVELVKTALAAAIICVLAPVSFPVGTVPISLATLAVYISAAALGKYRSTIGVLLYIVIGAVGLPVFSGFSGGIAKLIGPTGGYIVGYLPCAFIIGLMTDAMKDKKWVYPVSMVLGTAACYAFGTAWFMFVAKADLAKALALCVVPFLAFDAVKIVLASVLGYNIRKTVDNL